MLQIEMNSGQYTTQRIQALARMFRTDIELTVHSRLNSMNLEKFNSDEKNRTATRNY